MSRLELVAQSQAQESGFLALADIASLARETGIEYRVVGGLMVTLHLAVSGADDPTSRQTLDADLGVTQQVAADPALVAGLEGLGYERPESANRFIRQSAPGRRMVIDVLMPSYTSRMKTNQRAGEMTLDAIPGLHLALSAPGESIEIGETPPASDTIRLRKSRLAGDASGHRSAVGTADGRLDTTVHAVARPQAGIVPGAGPSTL